ncbi:PDZ domain-containing protein [Zoogloea ramigera]|uniref:PDZ domain-containing protein n=1 Tax=Zoogloea ramigera TaxID=350 RepID=A0A4Y4CPP3_ZOORA|nr:PDZ domain-containing protein [Zoogloea ramigera]GEC94838.1 PDZ domain-containing protein [Zoogloea ramigera]
MITPVLYTIQAVQPAAHLFEVSLRLAEPDPAGQVFSLPAWIPGSYMIREFARNIVSLSAEAGGKAVPATKLDKHSWRLPAGIQGPVTLRYTVYAWDLSVRSAHLDQTHGFFNGTSVFLAAHGHEDAPHRVDIRPPKGLEDARWRVATSLPEAVGEKGAAERYGFGLYRADSYDDLIDHPVEMGTFTLGEFEACGVPHAVAITGRHDCDMGRLLADLKPVCERQIRLFGEPAPMSRYVFLTTAVGDGYGGLEHRASTALLCSRADLPHVGMDEATDGYRQFLGLCSHEYFHTWNVKRIKPAAFVPYRLAEENYTRLLWAFEGFTSYYDDLMLVRSQRIGLDDYLKLLAKTITQVHKGSGRHKQSVAESSFEAWTKYYRQDENSPNAIVSYYTKGALVALLLDLRLRAESHGARSLDTLMQALWQRHGQTGIGVAEDGIFALAAELGGEALAGWLQELVEVTAELPLEQALRRVGLKLAWELASPAPGIGVRTVAEGEMLKIANVFDGGAAQAAGLSAGDVLVAIDGLKATAGSFDKLLARRLAGDSAKIHVFRRDELMRFEVELRAPLADTAKLAVDPDARANAIALREAWLA